MTERAVATGAATPVAEDRPGGRARILAAARSAFAARGYDGASTAAIARDAGVTQPLVHYHFATKEELWRAVVVEALSELDRFSDEVAASRDGQDGATHLESMMRQFVSFVATHPDVGRILIVDGARAGERLGWLIDEALGWRLRGLEEALEAGVTAGLLKPLPPALVALAFVAAAGYPFQVPEVLARVYGLDANDPDIIDAHVTAVAEIFLRGMLRDPRREVVDA
jgi:AcrR family transcriptional regulator